MKLARLAAVTITVAFVAACTDDGSTGSPNSAPTFNSDPAEGCGHGDGRAGQGEIMVPPTPVSVLVCSERFVPIAMMGPRHTRHTYTSDFDSVVTTLNAGSPIDQPKFSCNGAGESRAYTLVFHYDTGPDVAVDVGPDCQPSITNGSFYTNNTEAVLGAIRGLTGLN